MSSEANTIGHVRVGAAVGGALRLLVRRPFSVLAWGLFTTLAGFVPLSVILVSVLPGARAAAQSAAMTGQITATTAIWVQMAAAGVFAGLVAVVVLAVMDAAVYRAVLEPDNRGFFYLKLRRRELSIVGHFLIQAVLWAVLIAVASIPAAWVIGFIANTVGRSLAVLVSLVIALAAGFLFGIVGLRLSLAGPIAFDRGGIGGLASSWRATRDGFGPILAVTIFIGLIVWLWTYLLFALGHVTLISAATEWCADPTLERRAELVAILTLYFGVARVLVTAPGALICRQLSPARAAPVTTAPATKRQPLTLS